MHPPHPSSRGNHLRIDLPPSGPPVIPHALAAHQAEQTCALVCERPFVHDVHDVQHRTRPAGVVEGLQGEAIDARLGEYPGHIATDESGLHDRGQ